MSDEEDAGWADGLRADQATVAGCGRGHNVVLAGPGTGKTFVLVRRIQYLLTDQGVPPRQIAALTFTRAAAGEMRERLSERLGDDGKRVRVSTLHSFSFRELLRAEVNALTEPIRVVGDWEERNVVIEELGHMLGRTVREVENALTRLADDWDTLAIDGHGWEDGYPDPTFLGAWRRHREVYGYTLRSELVYQLLSQLRSDPDFVPGSPLQVLLVDEYQDLNSCDLQTIQLIARRNGAEVFATGDDDQSIYSFRHAHPAGIRNFAETYEMASQHLLVECLRCGPAVVDISNWLIQQELGRIPKELRSETEWDASVHLLRFGGQVEEAQQLADLIDDEIERGTPPEEILVLVKSDSNGKMTKRLVEELNGRGVNTYLPRQGPGTDPELQVVFEFLVLASLRASDERTDDLAIRALLELRTNGIGAARIRRVVQFCLERGLRFSEALEHYRNTPGDFGGSGLRSLLDEYDEILTTANALAPGDDEDFLAWVNRAFTGIGVSNAKRPELDRILDPLLAEFERQGNAGEPTSDYLSAVIGAMTLVGDTRPPRVTGSVTLTTMHGAKGLSSDIVIILQAEDEVIPGEAVGADEDEARRLLYVSLTRSKRRLVITACTRRSGNHRFVGTREVTARNLTRFLRDYGLTAQSVEDYLSLRSQ
jgi:DNA helicase II / ATP-dependent DNA helicase PcrA